VSPNWGPRRGGALPNLIVLHYTGMGTAVAAIERLCDPVAEVSAHHVIAEDGTVTTLVPEELRAWHAGAGCWGGVTDVNSVSIGVELANRGNAPFAAPLMAALEALLEQIMARWAIPAWRVIGHSDMAPARKADPGPRFDWQRLARAGLAVWPDASARRAADDAPAAPDAPDAATFRADLARIGYDPAQPDAVLLAALRLRFRPWGRGPCAAADRAIAAESARRFPVDRRDAGA